MGSPEVLIIFALLGMLVLPIVVVVWVAKASGNYPRNVALAQFLASSPDLRPAGVGLRLVAFLLDALVLGTALGLIAAGINALLEHESEGVTSLVAMVGWFAYFAGMEMIWGATVGKMALRLRVIRSGEGRPGLGAALVRAFCKVFGVYSPVGIITTIVCISGSPEAQRFGDRLAGTTVVRRVKNGLWASQRVQPPAPIPPAAVVDEAGANALNAPIEQASGDQDSETGEVVRGDSTQSRSGKRRVLILVLLIAAVASATAVVVLTRHGDFGMLNGGSGENLPSPTASEPSGPSGRTLLKSYLRQDVLPVLGEQMSYAAQMRSDKTPPGAQVIGAHRMTRPEPNHMMWWGKGKAEGRSLDEVSVQFGAITPPKSLRRAHQKLVRVFRIEADRWYAFTACERKRDSDAFWPEYRRWQSRSKTMLKTQQQLLLNWYFEIRVEADKQSVQVPGRIKSFVETTRMLTE